MAQTAKAQDSVTRPADSGAIDGSVRQPQGRGTLAGVRVLIKETGAVATTSEDGSYGFSHLAPGPYTLTFNADGYEPLTLRTEVGGDRATHLDAVFGPPVRSVDEVVVVAQRAPLALARSAQREAENIISVMPYEEIHKLPVVNAGDAVRIIPGVQLETDTGEGRFVNIRGLDSDLSSTTFGGVRLPPTDVTTSPYGGSRAVSFDAIPAEMIGAITVTKTNRPEQEAEALGGTIEISPKTVPLTGKPYFADIRLGSGVEVLRNTPITDLALTFGGRFGLSGWSRKGEDPTADMPFSFIGVFSYYEDKRGVDDLEEAYVDNQPTIPDKAQLTLEQRYYRQHKRRHVYGGELAYTPDSNNRFYVRFYDFGVEQRYNRNGLLYNFPGNPTVQPDGSFLESGVSTQKYYRSTDETFDTQLFTIGGNNDFGVAKIDYFLAHTTGSYEKPFDEIPVWTTNNTSTVQYNNSNSNFPSYSIIGGANPYDLTGYNFSGFSNSTQTSVTHDWSTKVNVRIPTHLTSYPTEEFKFGFGARLRKFDQRVTTYLATSVPSLDLTQAVSGPNLTYYDGHYQMGPLINPSLVSGAFANGAGFAHDPLADAANGARSSYNVTENVYAGYGQYQFGFGRLGIFAGLRIEATDSVFNAFAVTDQNVIQPVTAKHSYVDFLPSLQLRYEFTPTLIARAIYSSTIARPGYNQESPSLNINLPANLVSQGNPNIQPIHSRNVDLSVEKYLPGGGILSAGFFYKDLTNYIVPTVTSQIFPNSGLFAGFTGPVKVITFKNISGARALGYEFDYEQRFRFLPGWLSGFGTDLNWTGVDSRIEIRPGEFSQLPSTARDTANATLFYEQKGRFEVRLGANYISRSLFAIGSASGLDVFSEPRFSLDFGSRFFIRPNLSLYVDAKNLTNTPLKFTEGSPNRPIQRETYRETIQVGIEASF